MSKYRVDLNKIKNNFKKYQSKTDDKVYSGGTPNFLDRDKIKNKFKQYQTKTDDKVYSGGTPNFNEKTGKYTVADAYKKYLTKPQEFKNNFVNKIKKYMNVGGNTTTNTDNSENNSINQDADGNTTTNTNNSENNSINQDAGGNTITNTNNSENNSINQDAGNKEDWTTNFGGNTTTNASNSENNNINQYAGNKGDWTTNVGNNNDIKYSNIGNDYSVNIGGIGDGFSNMQGAAAYTALNNNQFERSKSDINGIKRSAQASEQATGLVGAKDRAANLYNSIGYSQNYWRQKANAQQNFYLGDIYAQGAPDFQLPEAPSNPSDGDTTQDTVDDFRDDLD